MSLMVQFQSGCFKLIYRMHCGIDIESRRQAKVKSSTYPVGEVISHYARDRMGIGWGEHSGVADN